MIHILKEERWRDAIGLTHTRDHHADEVFATVMLEKLFRPADFLICRTRNTEIISQALADNCHIVYDVGGKYDAANLHFDHHQRDFDERREPRLEQKKGTKYATAGLVWRKFGVRIAKLCTEGAALSNEGWKNVARSVDHDLIEGIDAFDNGEIQDSIVMSVSTAIQRLNSTAREREKVTDGFPVDCHDFMQACEEADTQLKRAIEYAVAKELEKESIIKLIGETTVPGQCFLLLDKCYSSWREVILELSAQKNDSIEDDEEYFIFDQAAKLGFCIFQRDVEAGEWCIQAIPPSEDRLMEQRESFPENWRGLQGEALARESGVPSAFFCHTGGFFAKTRTLKDAISLVYRTHKLNGKY